MFDDASIQGVADQYVTDGASGRLVLTAAFPLRAEPEVSRFVSFDLDDHRSEPAPFVHPFVEGVLRRDRGFRSDQIEAPYVKPKDRVDPARGLRRIPGEALQGSRLTPVQRMALHVEELIQEQIDDIELREEIMAIEILRTGQLTISGEGFPTQLIDFERASSLTRTKEGNARWGEEEADPIADLEAGATLIQDASGANASLAIMDPKAWALARVDSKVEKLLDTRRGSSSELETGPLSGTNMGRYVGSLGTIDLWVYQEVYPTASGTAKLLPDHTVLQVAPGERGFYGRRKYAAIRDEEGEYLPRFYFPKTWTQKDPAGRYVMTQSAPIPVPLRINASSSLTVR